MGLVTYQCQCLIGDDRDRGSWLCPPVGIDGRNGFWPHRHASSAVMIDTYLVATTPKQPPSGYHRNEGWIRL